MGSGRNKGVAEMGCGSRIIDRVVAEMRSGGGIRWWQKWVVAEMGRGRIDGMVAE